MKTSDVVLAALAGVDWDKEFETVLEMLFVGFALPEKIIKENVPVPEHLRPRLDSSLSNLKRKFEDGGAVRGFFLKDPNGPVEAARAWLAERRRELAQLLSETGGGAVGGNVDDVPQGDEDKAVGAAPPVAPPVDDVPHVAGDKASGGEADGEHEKGDHAFPVHGDDVIDRLSEDVLSALEKHPAKDYGELDEGFRKEVFKLPPFVVEGMLRRGETTLLFADGGEGKSWLALQLVFCLAVCYPFIGRRVRRMHGYYFDCEMGEVDQYIRLRAIAHKLGYEDKPIPVTIRDSVGLPPFDAHTIEGIFLYDCKRKDLNPSDCLLVVDSLAEVEGDADENTADMVRVLGALRDNIAHKYGTTVLVIHHTNKRGKLRGFSSIKNSGDNVWSLEKGILKCLKARRGCDFGKLTLDRDLIPTFLPASDELDKQETAGFVWVEKAGKPKTSGSKDHPQMTPAQVDHCRAVLACFDSIDEELKAGDLAARFIKRTGQKERTATTARNEASFFGYIVQRHAGRSVVCSLAVKGREHFQKNHANAAG